MVVFLWLIIAVLLPVFVTMVFVFVNKYRAIQKHRQALRLVLQVVSGGKVWIYGDLFDEMERRGLILDDIQFSYLKHDLICSGLLHQWQDGPFDVWRGKKIAPNRYQLTEKGKELFLKLHTKEGRQAIAELPFTR